MSQHSARSAPLAYPPSPTGRHRWASNFAGHGGPWRVRANGVVCRLQRVLPVNLLVCSVSVAGGGGRKLVSTASIVLI